MPHPHVMVSHSSLDKDIAREIAMILVAEGIDVWFDEWEIDYGDSIPAKIEETLARATHVLLVWSAHAANSSWVSAERRSALAAALDSGAPRIVAIRLDGEPLPSLLNDRRYMRWAGGTDDDHRNIVQATTGHAPTQNLVRALAAKYHSLIEDPSDPFGVRACPRCGSDRLDRGSVEDSRHDDVYLVIKCEECGWGEWTG